VRPRKSAVDIAFGDSRPVDRDALIELEIRLGEQGDGTAPRRNRRARDYRVAGPLSETIEDSIEVVAGVRNGPQDEVKLPADVSHELDAETALDAALHDIEWWIGIGRLDYECAGMQGADHPFLPTHGVITRRARSTPNSASTFGVLFSHPDSVRHDLHAGHRANR